MKTMHIARILTACLVLSLVFFSACNDDEESGNVELLSFGPSGVKHGDEIVFIGKNLNKVDAIVFQPGVEVAKESFTSVSSTEIRIVVPNAAQSGKVKLKTGSEEIESKSIFSLEVPVTIETFTAEAKPGTDITITGQYLNWIESVTFNDGLVVTEFKSKSLNELVVTVPMEAKTGFLEFITGGTVPLLITTLEPLVVTLPEVTGFSPAAVRHAAQLTLMGTDLDLVTAVTFGGGAVVMVDEFETHDESQIVLTVPVTSTSGPLTLTALSGVTVETPELPIVLPVVTAFSPSNTQDHDPGVTLTMTGTDLDLVEEIRFPNVANAVTDFTKTDTEIQVVIPAGAQGGTVVFVTIHDVVVPVAVPFGDQLVLAKTIFSDAIQSPFGVGGGWGGVTTDAANTENPRLGSVSVKTTFANSWGGGCQFGTWGNSPLPVDGAAYFAFSIYGGPGTEGKEINVNVSGTQAIVVIEEGEWKDVTIPLSQVGNPTSISEIWFQDRGWAGTVYIDHVGLK